MSAQLKTPGRGTTVAPGNNLAFGKASNEEIRKSVAGANTERISLREAQ